MIEISEIVKRTIIFVAILQVINYTSTISLLSSSFTNEWNVKPPQLETPTSKQRIVIPPPRKLSDTNNTIYFIHVGKAGGTSVDRLFYFISQRNKPKRRYVGKSHYDWSWILKNKKENETVDIISFLRDPLSRAESQYYYSMERAKNKKQPRTTARTSISIHTNRQTFSKSNRDMGIPSFNHYVREATKNLPGWMQPIADGESGVYFFAGLFGAGWVKIDETQSKEFKKSLRKNKTACCLRAAKRLDETLWFGLIEDIPRSMELLRVSMELDDDWEFPRMNYRRRSRDRQETTNTTIQTLRRFLPMDIWFYEYASRLFDARWDYFVGNSSVYIHPDLPPFPDFSLEP